MAAMRPKSRKHPRSDANIFISIFLNPLYPSGFFFRKFSKNYKSLITLIINSIKVIFIIFLIFLFNKLINKVFLKITNYQNEFNSLHGINNDYTYSSYSINFTEYWCVYCKEGNY